jgi:hypothetical protein
MDASVVMCLDRNKLVDQDGAPPAMYMYEAEAVSCAESWRTAARWKGGVYAVQYRGREVSEKTEKQLRALGVDVVTLEMPPVRRAFMEVVYALAQAEKGVFGGGRIFYSDLDVVMKGEVPSCFFWPGTVALYYYRQDALDRRRDPPEFAYRLDQGAARGFLCHNTYFQAFDAGGGFQQAVYDAASTDGYARFFRDCVYYAPKDDDYFFEEGAYDYVCARRGSEFAVKDFPCPASFFDHVHAHRRILQAGRK